MVFMCKERKTALMRRFFPPDVWAAVRPKHPVIASEKPPPRISLRGGRPRRAACLERAKNQAKAPVFRSGFFPHFFPE